jgi:predicted ATPase/class 3 adenylate cyclase
MDFVAVVDQVIALFRQRGRVTYRTLQIQFALDDAQLAALKDELLYSQPQVIDDAGHGLVWTGEGGPIPPTSPTMPQAPSPPATPPAARPPPLEAERRQLTVLFCDLVDSTALSSQLDPEDLREVVRAYQDTCAQVIVRYEGHIAQYLGDGLLVYFGYPLAHEDDAQRAVRAGLRMVEAMGQLNTRLARERGVQLAVRLGIHTGLVVVGEIGGSGRQEQLALGETPNIAARFQGLAAPDTVVISEATLRVIQGYFLVQDLGPQTLRGVATPLRLRRVLGESGAQSRLDVAVTKGLTPLVGREQEVGLLVERWAQVQEGLGHVIVLSGEAGIGKSRLVQVLKDRVAGEKALPSEVLQQVVAKTDGVPLFVEELTKMVLESGLLQECEDRYELTGPLPALAIPTTLQDSLMARLDRLSTVKAVAQLGATIGRQFSYDLLQAVAPLDEAAVQHALRQLVDAELVYQRGVGSQALYTFKHALIQDAAYQSLLKSTRQQYHQRIAQALEVQFPKLVETQPEWLAHHYTEAGHGELAAGYWHKAGQRAIERSAHVEAINHLTKGLEVLQVLPETPERTRHALRLHITLGMPLIATKGYAAPEVGHVYTRARELCQQVGDFTELFSVLRGLWIFYVQQGQLQTACELGEQLLRQAQEQHDAGCMIEAHRALGSTLYFLGDFAYARVHLEQGMALYDPQQHHALAFRYGQDPGVVCRAFAAVTLWSLGYPEEALRRSREALTLAQELAHPFSLTYAMFFTARLHQHRREAQATYEQAEALMTLAREQGFAQLLAMATMLRGWALTEQGEAAEGISQMHHGLASYRSTAAEVSRPFFLGVLAAQYGREGQATEGLRLLEEALATVPIRGQHFYEAELHRLTGEIVLLSSADQQAQAETCFQQTLALARRQQTKSLELRATTSLSRLWQHQGKQDEARALLATIYGWFPEGSDTADLQEAKALLAELGG